VDVPACSGIKTKSAAPMAISMCVRIPALLPCRSRSYPSTPPRAAATRTRNVIRVMCVASGIVLAVLESGFGTGIHRMDRIAALRSQ
jgi:hypothetical protein